MTPGSADEPPVDELVELVDVVDEHDGVIDTVPRARMRADNLRHRSVAIVVRHRDGRLLVHRRADHKDVWPGRWDLCVGGVVGAGEDVDTAAARELAEEIGVVATPTRIGHGVYEDDDVRAVVTVYEVTSDGPFRFDDGEVVEARLVSMDELTRMLSTHPFVPDSVAVVVPMLTA